LTRDDFTRADLRFHGWACEDLNLGPLPYQANARHLGPCLMCPLSWRYRPCASVLVFRRPPRLSRSSSLRAAVLRRLTPCLQNTSKLSGNVADLGLSVGRIRWDRPVSGPDVVSLGGQRFTCVGSSLLIRRDLRVHPSPGHAFPDVLNATQRPAVGGDVERRCAAKIRPAWSASQVGLSAADCQAGIDTTRQVKVKQTLDYHPSWDYAEAHARLSGGPGAGVPRTG
jgi:hypothetical protein